MQKLVHRAFLIEPEIIRLGPTAGVGVAGAEPVFFAARPPRFFAAHSSGVLDLTQIGRAS